MKTEMKVVYVAGPFRGANGWEVRKNIRRAEELGYQVAAAGGVPLIPHANTAAFDGTFTDQYWLDATLELMRRCDAVIMTLDWERSSGACGEHKEALTLGMPVFYSMEEIGGWLAGG